MKQKLVQRLKDRFSKSTKIKRGLTNAMASFVGEKEVLQRFENEWRDVAYVVEQGKYSFQDTPKWNLTLTGIVLPWYDNSITSLIITGDLFCPFLEHLDVGVSCLDPCHYHRQGRYQIPVLPVEDLPDGNTKARTIIDGYVQYRSEIEKALAEIDRVYPTSWQEGKALMSKFKEEFEWDFIKD